GYWAPASWFQSHGDLAGSGRHRGARQAASRPAHFNFAFAFATASGEDPRGRVLRPVPTAALDFMDPAPAAGLTQAHRRSDALRIMGRSFQSHPQPRGTLLVAEQTGGRPVLAHRQIHAPIMIKVCRRR